MRRTVVLDGHTLNPGDLSWDGLRALGECEIYDRTPPDQTVPRAAGAPVVLTNKTVLDRTVIEGMDDLRYIGVLATGYNVVDLEAAAERGIPVTNVPTYGTDSVAEMVFAHIFALARRVAKHAAGVREGEWARSPDFCYCDYPQVELAGLTMGIVGFGRIGRAVATRALAFGMRVLAYDVETPDQPPDGVEMAGLDRLSAESDIVTLHVPLTPRTEGMVGAERLALMKPAAFLINTSRGPVVDEAALAEALEEGRLAGAGLDVLSEEPPDADNPLLQAPNCHVTPHIAWATRAARARLMETAVGNVRAWLDGSPRNVVNGVT
ncbi:MAG: D-2-hydroxyacid dehydrogenase [Candidatus Brocadiia bacterium]